jgi:hypothetical protein
MSHVEYREALQLLSRAHALLESFDERSSELLYDFRRLRIAWDLWCIERNQPAPELQLN